MCADELFPRRGCLPFWGRWDTVPLQDVAHRLVAERVAQVRQGADDSVVAPGAILLCQAYHQRLQLWINPRTPWSLPLRGAVKFLGDQPAMPAENGIGLDDRGHFLQGLLPQLLADGGQRRAFAIRQPHTACDLVAQDAILRHQVFVTQEECLVD
jgi:hypothetical protein